MTSSVKSIDQIITNGISLVDVNIEEWKKEKKEVVVTPAVS